MLISCLPMVISILLIYLTLNWLSFGFLGSLFIGIILLPFTFILGCYLVRLALPPLKKGHFPLGLNKKYITWGAHLSLGRSIRVFQLKDFIYSSYILKYLYWKAMGAKIAFGINSSMYVNLIDLPLITIEKGVTLGDQVQLSCHIIANGKIVLGEIKIGEGTFVSFETSIGPMSKIGKNCFIGPGQKHLKLKLKDGEKTGSEGE